MKLAICAGPATTGKTAVLRHLARRLLAAGQRRSPSSRSTSSTPTRTRSSPRSSASRPARSTRAKLCPDHCNVMVLGDALDWARNQGAATCSSSRPPACACVARRTSTAGSGSSVLEATSGMNLPLKVGPMLSLADVAVVTKIDRVSQAEREVFRARIQDVAPNVRIREVDALQGIGIDPLVTLMLETPDVVFEGRRPVGMLLRGDPPVGTCTICVGRREIGWQNALRRGPLPREPVVLPGGVNRVSPRLLRSRRDDPARPPRRRGDGPLARWTDRQSVEPPPRRARGPRGRRGRREPPWRASSAPNRPRSSSPGAAPRPTTSRSSAWSIPRRPPGSTSSPAPSSTRRCSSPAAAGPTGGRARGPRRSRADGLVDPDALVAAPSARAPASSRSWPRTT